MGSSAFRCKRSLSIVVGDIAKPSTKYFQLCCSVVPFEFKSVRNLQLGNAV